MSTSAGPQILDERKSSQKIEDAKREYELGVGRRTRDGKITLSALLPEVLTLSVTYGAERASTVMLTLSQVKELRHALTEMESLISPPAELIRTSKWDGGERRRTAA